MTLLACPVCNAPLLVEPDSTQSISCERCRALFPRVGTIPVLTPLPGNMLADWRRGLARFVTETDNLGRQLAADTVEPSLGERSRARLSAIVERLPEHRERILELFADAGILPKPGRSTPEPPSLLAYYSLVHRDYSWPPEVDEVTPSVDAIRKTLPKDFQLGNTLILGAGTARLGWELANCLHHSGAMVALDINPLPFLVTQRLMAGDSLKLLELPAHPRHSDLAAVERELTAPGTPPPGLQLVFADALKPPVLPGSFDTVITPWFVDQVPENPATIPPLIRSLLRDDGAWLNHGPFVYEPAHTRPAFRYAVDEFLHLVASAGFKVSAADYETTPYMASPVSSQGRTETVLSMHAVKLAKRKPTSAGEPDWLNADAIGVPLLPGLSGYQAPHPIINQVAQLIDGSRTPRDIASALVARGELVDDGNQLVAVRACLKVIYQTLARTRPETDGHE
jgi:uncharacterized protein YbaR (Trm112 family)